jgi:hypothetical protein
MYGRVFPPDDLEPAINALTVEGRKFLESLCKGREITPSDIAKAADFERGDGES